jgi:hypothetical protein
MGEDLGDGFQFEDREIFHLDLSKFLRHVL